MFALLNNSTKYVVVFSVIRNQVHRRHKRFPPSSFQWRGIGPQAEVINLTVGKLVAKSSVERHRILLLPIKQF